MSEQVSVIGEECRSLSNAWRHKEVVNYKFSIQKSRKKFKCRPLEVGILLSRIFYP